MLNEYPIQFCFLEKRDYVHGTQIFRGVLKALEYWNIKDIIKINATFNDNLAEHGSFCIIKDELELKSKPIKWFSKFKLTLKDRKIDVGLKGSGDKISQHKSYNEDNLIKEYVNRFQFENFYGLFPKEMLINLIVALNKQVHFKKFKDLNSVHWFLARIIIDWELVQSEVIEHIGLSIIKTIGTRMTKSTIKLNNQNAGEIYFNRGISSDRY